MISSLKINNIALIDESVIKLGEGFNALTGETGAGKSIIIDSLNFVLGSKADKTLVKTGKDFARVEVVFDLPCLNDAIIDFFDLINVEPENTIIITRNLNVNGKNEIRVNGEAVTLSMLKKLTINLVDIHGQHDHQALLDSKNHIKIIDSLDNNIQKLKDELNNKILELKEINSNIDDLGGEGEDKLRNIKLLEHEINEIEMADLKVGEEEDLIQKRKYYANSEKLSRSLNEVYVCLKGGDAGVGNQIKSAIYSLGLVSDISQELTDLNSRLSSTMYEINDITDAVSNLLSQTDYDEDEVNLLEERLDLIKDLKRKYGSSVEDVFVYLETAKSKLNNLLNSEQALQELNKQKQVVLEAIYGICEKLTLLRENVGNKIKDKLLNELADLGIKNAQFKVVFNNDYSLNNIENKFTKNGADNLEFMFSANPGIEIRPLSKIISGGELSRFMLAFKCVVKDDSGVKTMIFDEIDSGIGGLIGIEVGKKISNISKFNQVVCITHLAQIAAFADDNYKIEKSVNDNYTKSSVIYLNNDGKVTEITRMLGLNPENKSGVSSANDLIVFANNYKNNIN